MSPYSQVSTYHWVLVQTDRENTVNTLAEDLSQALGLLSTANAKALLQKLRLVDKSSSFNHRQTHHQTLLPP